MNEIFEPCKDLIFTLWEDCSCPPKYNKENGTWTYSYIDKNRTKHEIISSRIPKQSGRYFGKETN